MAMTHAKAYLKGITTKPVSDGSLGSTYIEADGNRIYMNYGYPSVYPNSLKKYNQNDIIPGIIQALDGTFIATNDTKEAIKNADWLYSVELSGFIKIFPADMPINAKNTGPAKECYVKYTNAATTYSATPATITIVTKDC